jgi:hypothetical protein
VIDFIFIMKAPNCCSVPFFLGLSEPNSAKEINLSFPGG